MEAERSDLVYGVGEGSPEDQEAERRRRSYLDKEVQREQLVQKP